MSEYQRFEAAIDKYEKEVQKILGIKAISTLETGTINNFKKNASASYYSKCRQIC